VSADPDPAGAERIRLADGSDDLLLREEPLVLDIAGQELVTMRTPGRDRDLAVGFLLSEGIVQDPSHLDRCDEIPARSGEPARVAIALSDAAPHDVRGRLTRTHEIRSSCGICGLGDPSALLEALPPLAPGTPKLPWTEVPERARAAAARQPLFRATGASHGAVLFGPDGEVWADAEDVGRHNALDKALGQAALAGRDLSRAAAFLSGRAGFDLVVKCLRLQVAVILSVSAPSALGVHLCREAGATLIGFVRGEKRVLYCDLGRVSGR